MTDLAADAAGPMLPSRRLAAGTLASLVVHALLIAALLLFTPLRQLVVPAPEPVTVEIVTDAQFRALATLAPAPTAAPEFAAPASQDREAAASPQTKPAPAAPASAPSTTPGIHIATHFYAGSILKEPGMERIRRTLDSIAPSERLVQLCNIEGLEQIRRGAPDYDPDTLVSYAMSDPLAAGLTLSAPGAAFRSRRRWYGVAFTCRAAADLQSVTAFEFRLGEPIPHSEWEAHDLTAEDSDE